MGTAASWRLGLAGGIALVLALSFVSPLVLPAPSPADTAPESAILVHVQSVSGGYGYEDEWCQRPPVSSCHDVVRTTSQEGPLEFLICFMSGWVGGGDCLETLQTSLIWPETWELVSFEPRGDCGGNGTLSGGDMHLWWDSYMDIELGGMLSVLPVARLVMNVNGPGQLGFSGVVGDAVLRAGCGSTTYVTHPYQKYAEAGITCGHSSPTCSFHGEYCTPVFQDPELVLRAPVGGSADSTALFSFDLSFCYYEVYTNAPWCAAYIETQIPWSILHVTADAAGLAPATYETAIELYQPYIGVSRCLPVTFIVEETIAISSESWGRIKALYR